MAKKSRDYGIKAMPVRKLIAAHFPEVADDENAEADIARNVFRFSTKLIAGREFGDGNRRLGREHMRGQSTDVTERIRDFRAAVLYSAYLMSDFWRAMYLHVNGIPYRQIVKAYPVHRADLLFCLEVLDHDDTEALLYTAQTSSTYRIDQEDREWLMQKATVLATRIANTKLRYLSKYDPSLDPRGDLLAEATRIINTYSHYPSKERIWGAVALSLPREAERLRQFHQALSRRAVRKLPSFRCPCCKKTWEHEKNKGIITLMQTFEHRLKLSGQDHDHNDRYCEACSIEQGQAVKLERINGEREYMATLVSSSPVESDEGGSTYRDVEDENAMMGDDATASMEFFAMLAKKVDSDAQAFLTIFLGDDDAFDAWLHKKGATRMGSNEVFGALVCEYLGLEWGNIKEQIGDIIGKPRPYMVKVEGDVEVVFARSAKQAVQYVAEHYHYADGKAMQADCGKVRVREYIEFHKHAQHLSVKEGEVISADDLPR